MPHHTPLIGTIVVGLVVAFLMGALAHKLRVSPVAGYLFAGVLVGPFTPGFVADTALANELAELGVILLMFGVGLHFSLRDLLSVRRIAVPGAVLQISVATGLGLALALYLGWSLIAGLVFGLALSVASTVVLLRAMQSRNLVDTERGRIAIGWLIVEDLAMVFALVLLPPVAAIVTGGSGSQSDIAWVFSMTFLKVGGFIALMLIVGKRVIPAALHWAAHTGSRELFRLAVLSIALGVAFGAAAAFDVSFALGAFFAGMILGETQLSRRAAEETLPLRDAFAVLFFVSVGMLFDPGVLVEQPLPLLVTLLIIIVGKTLAAFGIVRAFGYDNKSALVVAASLAQIGEFSFILAGLGTGLGLLPEEGRDLILAGAIFSILVNPFIFTLVAGRLSVASQKAKDEATEREIVLQRERRNHVILVGHGRVGAIIAKETDRALIVVEERNEMAKRARDAGLEVVVGTATDPQILSEAGIDEASKLIVAIPESFESSVIVERARKANPGVVIFARAHSDEEVDLLEQAGANHVIMGEREIARTILNLVKAEAKAS